MGVFEELEAETRRGGKRAHNDRQHAGDVGVDLLDSDAWLEPGETLVAEVAKMGFIAIKLERSD